MEQRPIDCLIIGGGPAGLTAAIYLARYHLNISLVDAGDGRCAMIPRTHNHAGYPGGIAGRELLARMRTQAGEFGVRIADATVDRLERADEGFTAKIGHDVMAARSILLATGVVNHRPPMDDAAHDEALARGLLRYCPVCDGYEVTDRRVGVIGTGDHGAREALFLRGFTRDVTLIAPDAEHAIPKSEYKRLRDAGVTIRDGPCDPLRIEGDRLIVPTPHDELAFDSVYPALGSRIRSRLAQMVGAAMSEDGCLTVDEHQRTSVAGLYAAGDVVKGLDQISHAMGQAGVAATAIRNALAETSPVLR